MTEPSLSVFVKRCQDALAEYSRLRFLGVSHEMARKQSGFERAVRGELAEPVDARDVRKVASGDTGE
jgi:hypothetical protein